SEKNECSQPSEGINNSQSAFEQREREKAKIDNENIAEQERWPVCDRWKREQIKRREHRNCRESERAGKKLMIHFSGPLCPGYRCQKQSLKSDKDCHDNKNLVADEIFFGNKERRDPGELH